MCDKPKKYLTGKFLQNDDQLNLSDNSLELYWYKLYLKSSELHLLILSIDWS